MDFYFVELSYLLGAIVMAVRLVKSYLAGRHLVEGYRGCRGLGAGLAATHSFTIVRLIKQVQSWEKEIPSLFWIMRKKYWDSKACLDILFIEFLICCDVV
jgi:hypothetical protein